MALTAAAKKRIKSYAEENLLEIFNSPVECGGFVAAYSVPEFEPDLAHLIEDDVGEERSEQLATGEAAPTPEEIRMFQKRWIENTLNAGEEPYYTISHVRNGPDSGYVLLYTRSVVREEIVADVLGVFASPGRARTYLQRRGWFRETWPALTADGNSHGDAKPVDVKFDHCEPSRQPATDG